MGRYSRSNFLQRRLISLRTDELERKNSELMMKNDLLAESRAENIRTARRSEQIFAALSEALPGHVLDEKYRIEEKIGSGGFGTVYRGEHILLHHPVAIKVFRPAVGQEGVESHRALSRRGNHGVPRQSSERRFGPRLRCVRRQSRVPGDGAAGGPFAGAHSFAPKEGLHTERAPPKSRARCATRSRRRMRRESSTATSSRATSFCTERTAIRL